jgi:hypothetical protein
MGRSSILFGSRHVPSKKHMQDFRESTAMTSLALQPWTIDSQSFGAAGQQSLTAPGQQLSLNNLNGDSVCYGT